MESIYFNNIGDGESSEVNGRLWAKLTCRISNWSIILDYILWSSGLAQNDTYGSTWGGIILDLFLTEAKSLLLPWQGCTRLPSAQSWFPEATDLYLHVLSNMALDPLVFRTTFSCLFFNYFFLIPRKYYELEFFRTIFRTIRTIEFCSSLLYILFHCGESADVPSHTSCDKRR